MQMHEELSFIHYNLFGITKFKNINTFRIYYNNIFGVYNFHLCTNKYFLEHFNFLIFLSQRHLQNQF